MPFVTITLLEGKDKNFINSLSDIIHTAMYETINFPPEVLFHKIHEMKKGQMIFQNNFRNIQRSENMIYIECTIKKGRSVEQKQSMYQRISENLSSQLGVRAEDIIIIIRENSTEDWYLNPK